MMIEENVILKQFTTFKCGGPARYFAEPESTKDLIELFGYARDNDLKVLILGLGSNMLISDKGFDGLVIRIGKKMGDITVEDDGEYKIVTASAGCSLALFGSRCASEGLEGAEFCCGIPGTIGGAVFMNAGAYGREIKDIAVEVTYLLDNEVHTVNSYDCDFGYRKSIFEQMDKEGRQPVILSLKARLKKGDMEKIRSYVTELKEKRCASQPIDVPSAGSTFKRPEGHYAGALIEGSGLKGFALDDSGAQVSPKHAGFVVNNGGKASAADVMRLIRYIQDKVYKDSGVRLETEVRLIGGDGN